jgi:phenylalanyl-tRNA synthetase beta subunit
VNQGFSEIYGYAFAEKGEIELANSVAPEKKYLRSNLSAGMKDYLEFNARYSELIDMTQIKIFEIGKVFGINDEHNNLVLGVKTPSGNKSLPKDEEVLNKMIETLEKELGQKMVRINKEKEVAEFNFDELTAKLPEAKAYDIDLPLADKDMRFKKISVYPFSVRDVAVFVPEGTDQKTVQDIVEKEAGSLLVKIRLFDVFTKKFPTGGAKTSYAFRLVLQSYEHTLSEEEINTVMAKITSRLNTHPGWQVR